MEDKSPEFFTAWSRSYRMRLEPIIRQRFADSGQSEDAADHYINGVCWAHPRLVFSATLQKGSENRSDQAPS